VLGWEDGESAVGGCTDLESTLKAVMRYEGGAEDLRKITGDIASKRIHLPETVLCSNEALSDDDVIEGSGADVGYAVAIALNGDRSGQARNGDVPVNLRKSVMHDLANPMTSSEECSGEEE
jgi:hypothetical protein